MTRALPFDVSQEYFEPRRAGAAPASGSPPSTFARAGSTLARTRADRARRLAPVAKSGGVAESVEERSEGSPTDSAICGPSDFAKSLRGEALKALDGIPALAQALARLVGVSGVEDAASAWTVAGHTLRVRLWRDTCGVFVFRVEGWPTRPTRLALTLAQVFAAHVTGDLRPVRGPEAALWKRRMLRDLGFLDVPPRELPEIPTKGRAPAAAVETWRELAAFLGLY